MKASETLENEEWDSVITSSRSWFDLNFREVWKYRDLIVLFVRRNLIANYKQTVLGPLWFIIQPLATTLMFTIVFGKIANIPTDGLPQFVFYMSGVVCWGYFSICLTETSETFNANAGMFGKVYFPRVTVPISIVITNIFKFLIQFIVFLGFMFYFMAQGAAINPGLMVLFLPLLVFQMGMLSLGLGVFISSMTTRYKDLRYLVGFGVSLAMYATPVIYPLSEVPEKYRFLFYLNPMSGVIEVFRKGFLGVGQIDPIMLVIGWVMTIFIFFIGFILFSRIEKTFMDTV